MFLNYLKTALRSLKKQRLFSLINILGLAAGMAGFSLFALTAGVKLNADRFHIGADRIHAVVQVARAENKDDVHTAFIPGPLIPALQAEIPGIEDSLRIQPAGRVTIHWGNESFYENGALFVDANFLQFFTFALAAGNAEKALASPFSVVISETVARKYFGRQDPVGRELVLENKAKLTVTAVTRDLPRTSSITFSMLIPLSALPSAPDSLGSWQANPCVGFVRLGHGFSRATLEKSFAGFIDRHFPFPRLAPKRLYLFPLLDIRTKGSGIVSFWHSSNRAAIFITLALGIVLLLIVSVNFVSLSTARFMQRTREIGLRKTVGARRSQLVIQCLGESLLLAFISLPLAVLLYELAQPLAINQDVIGTSVTISNSIRHYPFLLKYMFVAALLTGLLSGLYPALVLSSIPPVQAAKGTPLAGPKKRRFSKIMIILQFFLASVLILASSIIRQQYGNLLAADFGHDRGNIAVLPLNGEAAAGRERIMTEISRRSEVLSVSAAAGLPVMWESPRQACSTDRKEDRSFTVQAYGIDFGFSETLNMRIVRGRSFRRESGDRDSFVINESAAKSLGPGDPLGSTIQIGGKRGVVVGVVRDFLFADVGFKIPPAALYIEPERLRFMLVKYSSAASFPLLRKALKNIWSGLVPGVPFECQTLQDHFSAQTRIIASLSSLFRAIGLAAIFFSCLGLLGLVSYLVEARTKTIGIQKALGATTGRVVWGIIREFMILVTIANIATVALATVGWNKVLQTGILFFTRIGAGTFLFVVLLTTISAFAAVAFRTLKAARANPVDSLRYE
jgi:putative ABC transport system permease protein